MTETAQTQTQPTQSTAPDLARQVLVSERTDQIYEHTILTRHDRKITAGRLDTLLDRLQADGRLETLWRRSGIIA